MTRNGLQQIYARFFNKGISPSYKPRYIQKIPTVKRKVNGKPIKDGDGNYIKTGKFKFVKHY